jgi:hypothetical protein
MIVTVAAFNTLYQFWIHTKTIKKLPAPLEFIFNTPSHHRVHHGSNPQYIDKNHAGSLIIWDRMFGTFEPEKEEVVYGITTPLRSFNPFWANFHYWKELAETASKTSSFKDKILVFLKPPGWFPADLGGFKPAPPVDPDHVHKFDVKISRPSAVYVLLHFAAILGITSYYMFFSKSMIRSGNPEVIVLALYMAAFIMFSLFTFGLILENRKSGLYWELARFGVAAGLVYFYRNDPNLFIATIIFGAVYALSWLTLWYFGKQGK